MKLKFLFFSILLYTTLSAQSQFGWQYLSYDEFDLPFDKMKLDDNGNKWMVRDGVLFCFNGTNWREYRVDGSDVVFFDIDNDNNLAWVVTYFNSYTKSLLYQLDLTTGVWTPFAQPETELGFLMRGVYTEQDGSFILLSNYFSYKFENGEWVTHLLNIRDKSVTGLINKIAEDTKGNKWIISDPWAGFHGEYVPFGVYHINSNDTLIFEANDLVIDTFAFFNHILIDGDEVPYVAAGDHLMRYKDSEWEKLYHSDQVDYFVDMDIGPKGVYLLEHNQITIVGDTTFSIKIDFSCNSIEVDEEGNIYAAGGKKIDDEWVAVLAKFTFGDFLTTGTMYIDENENGQLDTLEPRLPFYFISNQPENTVLLTNRLGDYGFIHSEPQSGIISTEGPKHFIPVEPSDKTYNYQTTSNTPIASNLNFGFKPDLDAIDLSVSLVPLQQANPGFETCYSVIAKNWAFTPNSGVVKCEFSDPLIYLISDPDPISLPGNVLTFQTSTLGFLEEERIKICFTLPPNGGLIGDTITAKATITSDNGNDWDIANNIDEIEQLITGPYDPNIIEVYPSGIGANGDIPLASEDLDYTIHFQNVGNDTARQVVVTNIIDPNLAVPTLEMQSASHEYKMEFIPESNMMKWIFPKINLVDSLTNEDESVGFLKYNIGLQPDLPKGTQIKNDANIFFDFNDPIMTNTVINTLADVVSNVNEPLIKNTCQLKFEKFENTLLIQNPSGGKAEIKVFDTSGKLVLDSKFPPSHEFEIPIYRLAGGMHFIAVRKDECYQISKHFFSQK